MLSALICRTSTFGSFGRICTTLAGGSRCVGRVISGVCDFVCVCVCVCVCV